MTTETNRPDGGREAYEKAFPVPSNILWDENSGDYRVSDSCPLHAMPGKYIDLDKYNSGWYAYQAANENITLQAARSGDGGVPVDEQVLADKIRDALRDHKCLTLHDGDEDCPGSYALVDLLSHESETIDNGIKEIDGIVDCVMDALSATPPAPVEPIAWANEGEIERVKKIGGPVKMWLKKVDGLNIPLFATAQSIEIEKIQMATAEKCAELVAAFPLQGENMRAFEQRAAGYGAAEAFAGYCRTKLAELLKNHFTRRTKKP